MVNRTVHTVLWTLVLLLTFGVIIGSIASIGAAQTTDTPTPETTTTTTPTATPTATETPTETPQERTILYRAQNGVNLPDNRADYYIEQAREEAPEYTNEERQLVEEYLSEQFDRDVSLTSSSETSTPTATGTPTSTPTSTPTGTASEGSAVPSFIIEIVTSTDPTQATDEQLNTVREWFFSNSGSLSETERNKVGSWISDASTSERDPSTSEDSNEPQNVVAEINDNLVLRDYSFDRDNGTVTLVLSADQYTQQLVLTDPNTADSEGVGEVRQKEITVPSGETVETEFQVQYGAYSGSATVWISAGAGETIYVSNSAQELIDRLQWVMIPVAGFAAAMSVFVAGLIYVWRKYRSVNKEYTNIFRDL